MENEGRIERDDIEIEHSRAGMRIDNYHCVEFVAVPPDFDIFNYLSMREQAGIFEAKNINLKQLQAICEGVKYSPVFSILNNTRLQPVTCMFFIKVVKELGLVLKTIHNPLRQRIDNYIQYFDEESSYDYVHVSGQEVKRLNITIVNIFNMLSDDVISEAMGIAKKLQEYQLEVDEKLNSIAL